MQMYYSMLPYSLALGAAVVMLACRGSGGAPKAWYMVFGRAPKVTYGVWCLGRPPGARQCGGREATEVSLAGEF